MRSPIRKGRSRMMRKPLMVSVSADCAAKATASEPIPSVVTMALTSTLKCPNNITRAIPASSMKAMRRKKGSNCLSRSVWVRSAIS